jgi:hypothetical protein
MHILCHSGIFIAMAKNSGRITLNGTSPHQKTCQKRMQLPSPAKSFDIL